MNSAQRPAAPLFAPVAATRLANPGYARMFAPGRLTLGVFFPIEAFAGDTPQMNGQVELAQRAEAAGFAALWFRDVPLRVPAFGDTGQVFDPWVWMAYIGALTAHIALATGAIVLPLRHPLHVAKASASIDRLTGGRLVMGVASGDRPQEFSAFAVDPSHLGDSFRERFAAIRSVQLESFPDASGHWGWTSAMDVVPKPYADGVPLLVTGRSRQDLDWIAAHADGWITYPRAVVLQHRQVEAWRHAVERAHPGAFRPFAQSLYIDLARDPGAEPVPIHLGWRLGREPLRRLLAQLRASGVNHVALNLKYGERPAPEVLEEIARHVLPEFASP